jgi:predicted DNA-binding transcriptional regulator AlpA
LSELADWRYAAMGNNRLIRQPEVLRRVGIKKSQLDEAIKDRRFPPPTTILDGGRAQSWLEDEIDAYIESRRRARDDEAAGGQ